MKFFPFALCCWLQCLALFALAQENPLSPFFYLPNGDKSVDALPLLSTSAEVHIAGCIADVRIMQRYKNDGKKPIEAIYVFPASTQAAVYRMQLQIGTRLIKAVIQEKQQAFKTYEKAKQEGKSASLLSQHRPNVFQMNIANLLPGDTIEVELAYTELLPLEAGQYSFVFPTVVGPRYSSDIVASSPHTSWVEAPYLFERQTPSYAFDLQVHLNAGLTIQKISSPSHSIQPLFTGASTARIHLDTKEATGGDRDFILHYQLAADQIQDGLLLWEGEQENFFLTMIQPPKAPTQSEVIPREYIFLLDVSGSMAGYPLDLAKGILKDLFASLSPKDYFNIVFFEGGAQALSETSIPATVPELDRAIRFIEGVKGGGGTEMLTAIQKAMQLPKRAGTSRSFAIVTDGYIRVEEDIFDYIRQHLGQANFFALGIGTSVNRHLIEGIARVAMSESFVATQAADGRAIAQKFTQYIQSPVLTDIEVQFEGIETYDVIPKQIPDLMAERPILVFGKYRGAPRGEIIIMGQQADQLYQRSLSISPRLAQPNHSALPYLWARHKVKALDDFGRAFVRKEEDIQTITSIGLSYSLLTNYTSFVAVDSVVRQKHGEAQSVKQPLPLPRGVPNSAIGSPGLGATTAELQEEDEPLIVDQGLEAKLSIETSNFPAPRTMIPPPPPPPPVMEEIFKTVEEMPYLVKCATGSKAARQSCTGNSLLKFFSQQINLPAIFQDSTIMGTSVIQFVIGKDGKIKSIKVIRSLHPDLDKELIRVARLLPDFVPGQQGGRKVDVVYNMPIRIHLK